MFPKFLPVFCARYDLTQLCLFKTYIVKYYNFAWDFNECIWKIKKLEKFFVEIVNTLHIC